MKSNDFKKLWTCGTSADYYPKETADILKSFNDVIHGLYALGGEEEYIFHTLNATTYVKREYKNFRDAIGMDLADIANYLEMMRSVLFGDVFNWDYVLEGLKEFSKCEESD